MGARSRRRIVHLASVVLVAGVTWPGAALAANPVAEDDGFTVERGATTLLDVLANDVDPDGDPIEIVDAKPQGIGSVTVVKGSPDQIRYTPPTPQFCTSGWGNPGGDDYFSYEINGGSKALVAVYIPCPDPVFPPPAEPPRQPAAVQPQATPPVPTCRGIAATIVARTGGGTTVGTYGNDVIVGTAGADRILGLGGDDVICAGGGDDRVAGGGGDDEIWGGAGDDTLGGGEGDDSLLGGDGADRLTGGSDDDRISGGAGPDRVFARDRKPDRVNCGGGRDVARLDRIDRRRSCER